LRLASFEIFECYTRNIVLAHQEPSLSQSAKQITSCRMLSNMRRSGTNS
jgi:hypothetical protein